MRLLDLGSAKSILDCVAKEKCPEAKLPGRSAAPLLPGGYPLHPAGGTDTFFTGGTEVVYVLLRFRVTLPTNSLDGLLKRGIPGTVNGPTVSLAVRWRFDRSKGEERRPRDHHGFLRGSHRSSSP